MEIDYSLHAISEDIHKRTDDLLELIKSDMKKYHKMFRDIWNKAEGKNQYGIKRDLLYLAGKSNMQEFRDIVEETIENNPDLEILKNADQGSFHHSGESAGEREYLNQYSLQANALISFQKLASEEEVKEKLIEITKSCNERHICADAVNFMKVNLKMKEEEILENLPSSYQSIYFVVKR